MLQNATPLRKSAPGPPNSSDEHVSCTAPAAENASLQILFKCPTLAIVFLEMLQNRCVLLTSDKVHNPLRLPRETTSERPKVVGTPGVFHILTSRCASRHNSVRFFDISTSKRALKLVCFVHFDFEMCFAPQRRALFRHLNFQKWSEHGVFCTFWLRNLLRATGSAPAALASLLFDPPEPQIIGKTVFRDFPTFLRACIFFLLTLSLLWSSLFCSSLFYSSLLSDSSHLCFSSVHIVGSLTSKLQSNMVNHESKHLKFCILNCACINPPCDFQQFRQAFQLQARKFPGSACQMQQTETIWFTTEDGGYICNWMGS